MIVSLDFSKIDSNKKFHHYLKKSFKLKHYYNNLDSFYDLLSTHFEELTIKVKKEAETHPIYQYLLMFYDTLNHLEKDNDYIKVIYE